MDQSRVVPGEAKGDTGTRSKRAPYGNQSHQIQVRSRWDHSHKVQVRRWCNRIHQVQVGPGGDQSPDPNVEQLRTTFTRPK